MPDRRIFPVLMILLLGTFAAFVVYGKMFPINDDNSAGVRVETNQAITGFFRRIPDDVDTVAQAAQEAGGRQYVGFTAKNREDLRGVAVLERGVLGGFRVTAAAYSTDRPMARYDDAQTSCTVLFGQDVKDASGAARYEMLSTGLQQGDVLHAEELSAGYTFLHAEVVPDWEFPAIRVYDASGTDITTACIGINFQSYHDQAASPYDGCALILSLSVLAAALWAVLAEPRENPRKKLTPQ